MTKLEAFTQYMSQFAAHRGADMQWVMEASSHGRIFSYAWDEATKAEREARPWQGQTQSAWQHGYEHGFVDGMSKQAQSSVDKAVNAMVDSARLHSEPKVRQPWNGLTDDDIAQAMYRADAIITGPMQFKFAREIEAKLKEKNT